VTNSGIVEYDTMPSNLGAIMGERIAVLWFIMPMLAGIIPQVRVSKFPGGGNQNRSDR
jgi:hypothetical protein